MAAVWLAGCASAPETAAPPAPPAPLAPPEDFALAVTRPPGLGNAESVGMRWILEPGGALRAAAGQGVLSTTYPPIARRLNEAQVAEVWSLATAAAGGQRGAGSEGSVVESGGTSLWLRADGEARVVRIEGSGGALIAELERLSWMR